MAIEMRKSALSFIVLLSVILAIPSLQAQSGSKGTDESKAKADIVLTKPTDAKLGENQFEVNVKGADGKPLDGADVSLLFVMPASPVMGEMRSEVKLKPSGGGVYAGPGNLMMAGKWNVTAAAKKDGKTVVEKKLTLSAK